MSNKKFLNILGNILMLLSFVFIANRIIVDGTDFTGFFSIHTQMVLAGSIFVYAIVVVVFAVLFFELLNLYNHDTISQANSVLVYAKSNLYKYLPGNIFHYLGRNQVALDQKIAHSAVIAASITEMLLISLAAVSVTISLAGKYAVRWIEDNYAINEAFLIALGLATVVGLFAMITGGIGLKAKERILSPKMCAVRDGSMVYFKLLMVYILIFVINGSMFIMVLNCLGVDLSRNLILPVIGIYSFSWLVGFITPGAPAGLGIREAIISALLPGIAQIELVTTAVILYRLVTILGDVMGFIIAFIACSPKKSPPGAKLDQIS